jgi:hypothetical protein
MKTSNHICQDQLCFLGLFTEDDLVFVVASRFPPLLSSAIVGGCLIGSLILDTNEGPDVNSMYYVNTMRDSFTCSPRFSGLLLAGDITHGA